MAELVVVSAVVLVALTGLYASYNKVISLYNQRINYYDVPTLYRLAYIRDVNDKNLGRMTIGDAVNDEVTTGEKVYWVRKNELNNLSGINPTFKDYLDYLSNSLVDIQGDDTLFVMEKCSGTENKSNCKYAYLEVNYEL